MATIGLRLLKSILILPGNVLVVIPALILWAGAGTRLAAVPASPADPRLWLGALAAALGLALAIWTVRDFVRVGQGTPAPWDPPKRLIVRGPYRHVRNPMMVGVILMLGAEASIAGSWPLAAWAALFVLANAIYIPLHEEPAIEKRFGEDYRLYKANVPRWLPRLTPWRGPEGT